MLNPNTIFRFDVRQINDVATFRSGINNDQHYIICACNDGYLKVFSLKDYNLTKAIKGLSANPLCIDVAGVGHLPALGQPRDIMAVGFEDDSFVVYSIMRDY